jgi:nucleoside-diphosphate-sugar epimerase
VNVGTEYEFTILEFAKKVIEITGSKSEIEFRPALVDDPKQRRPDLTRARTILGWDYSTTLEQGLAKTVEYFQGRLDTLAAAR